MTGPLDIARRMGAASRRHNDSIIADATRTADTMPAPCPEQLAGVWAQCSTRYHARDIREVL